MAQRHPVRDRLRLLILIAASVPALLAVGAGVAVAATFTASGRPDLPSIALGQVGSVGTEPGGLAQFTLEGPIGAGRLSLGLRPAPGSVLIVEGNEALSPTGRDLEGDLLTMSVRLEGTGSVWVVTGPTEGDAVQVLALFDRDGGAPDEATASQGFPSDRVLDALTRVAGVPAPSWFSPTRLGPWLVPRRGNDLPSLPGCAEPATAVGLRTCARESLAAIWNCLAHQDRSTRAIQGALAIYLDDRIAFTAAESAADGSGCGRVEILRPDPASRERAHAVIAGAFSTGNDAGQERADTEDPGVVSDASRDPGESAGGPEAPPAAPALPPEASPWEDEAVEEWGRQAGLADLMAALGNSCAGRGLLDALDTSEGTGLNTKVSLLAHELAASVEGWTGQVPDESDGSLRDAALALRGLPRGSGCEPVVAIMALIDEWSAREAEGGVTNGAAERFIAAFRDARRAQGEDLERWLPDRFPLLHRDADRILRRLD